MNKIKRLKKLEKRIERFERYIRQFKKWNNDAKEERKQIINSMTETELLLYGQEIGKI